MFAPTLVRALNHFLAGEPWARERLRAFGGQHLRLVGGPLHVDLAVDGEGLFQPIADGEVSPAVTIELPPDAPFRFLSGGREAVFAAARLVGAVDFAETLAFVFRHLHWDVEDDLARLVGDIAAHRLVAAGGAAFAWQRRAAAGFAANLAEYLGEEAAMLVVRTEMAEFSGAVERLCAEAEVLERRLARL